MTNLLFSAAVFAGSVAAGFVGSLTGLGGGVVIVPLLTIAFGVNIRYAIGASLVSVIATSSGAASAYVREGFSNVRIGMLLEIATSLGALTGAAVAAFVPTAGLAILLGVVLLGSVFAPSHQEDRKLPGPADPHSLGAKLGLNSSYPSRNNQARKGLLHTTWSACRSASGSWASPECCPACSESDRAR